MKKIKRTLLSVITAAAMAVTSLPFTAYALEPIKYVDENNVTHELVTKYTDDMPISELVEKMGIISPIPGFKAEYAGVFEGILDDKTPFSYTNDFMSLEDDTIYMTDMLIYNAKDKDGNKAFAVKFPQSTDLYLYRITNDSEYPKGTYIDENKVKHEVTRIPTDALDLSEEELIERNRVLNFNGSLIEYQGKYSEPLDKNVRYSGHTQYDYHGDIEVIYSTSMKVYFVRDSNGEKAYAVKFRQLPDLYLYTVKEIDEKNGLHWLAPWIIPEGCGSPVNYWENKKPEQISLDYADIEEINEKIGDLIPFAASNDEGVFPRDKYTFAGKFDKEVDTLSVGWGGFLFINYRYYEETNTIYTVHMVTRMVRLENGEEALLMRKEKSDENDWYIYKLSEKAVTPPHETEIEIMDEFRYYIFVDDGTGRYVPEHTDNWIEHLKNNDTDTEPVVTTALAPATITSPCTTVSAIATVPTAATTVTAKTNNDSVDTRAPASADANHLKGDANCDGKVNMADAVLIMQTLANPDKYKLTENGRANADMDGDGITNADALAIQKMLLKLD